MCTKTKEECEKHYMKHFINNPLFASTLLNLKQAEEAKTADTAIPFHCKCLPFLKRYLGHLWALLHSKFIMVCWLVQLMSLRNKGGVGKAIIGNQGHNGARREHLPEVRVLYWRSGCLDPTCSYTWDLQFHAIVNTRLYIIPLESLWL